MGDFTSLYPNYRQNTCPVLEQCCFSTDKKNCSNNGLQPDDVSSTKVQCSQPVGLAFGTGEILPCYDVPTGHQRGCDCSTCVATRAEASWEHVGDLRRKTGSPEVREIRNRLKSSCLMKENLKWDPTDESLTCVEKRFRQYPLGILGQSVVHYGVAQDLDIPKEISHGFVEKDLAKVSDSVNPAMKTCDEQRQLENSESIYHSNRFFPVGKCSDPWDKLPPHVDPEETSFGVAKKQSDDGLTVAQLVNPKIDSIEIKESGKCFKHLQKFTHQDYDPGEQISRNYGGKFDRNGKFGIETPNDPKGRVVRRVLTGWKTCDPDPTTLNEAYLNHVDFRNPKLGIALDRYKIGRTCGKDMVFGIRTSASTPTSEIIFNRCKDEGVKDAMSFHTNFVKWIFLMRKKFRGDMTREATIRIEDFFGEFLEIDDLGEGVVSWDQFHEIVCNYRLPIVKEKEDFQEVLAYFQIYYPPCDGVDYYKLIDFIKGYLKPLFPFDTTCLRPFYIPHTNGSIHHRTTYSDHTANACLDRSALEEHRLSRAAGKSKVELPSDAWSLINPSVYTTKGISNRDAWTPIRNFEMKRLLCLAGVVMSHDEFDEAWEKAEKMDPGGLERASFQTFREALHIVRETRNNKTGYREDIEISESA